MLRLTKLANQNAPNQLAAVHRPPVQILGEVR
jgi:hypothetical protein